MKKFLIVLGAMFMIATVNFAQENEENTNTSAETTAESAPVSGAISKGDSFMAAFGMGDSSIVGGGEAGGTISTAGAAAVAGTVASTGAANLTSSQNTPYSYK